MSGRIPRAKMASSEREFRSRLAQLVHDSGILRGTLAVRSRTCGKPTCRCAKGEKHVSLYLVVSEGGKYRQVFVPKDLEEVVRLWVENHQKARDLLEEISRMHYERIRKREV
jgi:uncharacterized protein DUF6788